MLLKKFHFHKYGNDEVLGIVEISLTNFCSYFSKLLYGSKIILFNFHT